MTKFRHNACLTAIPSWRKHEPGYCTPMLVESGRGYELYTSLTGVLPGDEELHLNQAAAEASCLRDTVNCYPHDGSSRF